LSRDWYDWDRCDGNWRCDCGSYGRVFDAGAMLVEVFQYSLLVCFLQALQQSKE
jgi:hypothetical protein